MGIMDQLVGANNTQKKAALDALARSGQSGLDAYNAGLSSVNDATQKAAATAASRGAWMGAQAQSDLAGTASSTGDAARIALERAKAAYSQNNADRTAATGAYFDEMNASVPLLQAWTDSKAKLAGQEYEQQLQREKEQQDWARQQHEMQMEMLRQQMAARAAASAGGGGSKGLTTAQQQKLAQAAASADQRAQEEAAMKQRLEEMNRAGELAFRAANATPNEQTPDERKYTSADAAERQATTINNARSTLMPNIDWNSGSLDEMAAAYDKIRQQSADATGNASTPRTSLNHFSPGFQPGNETVDLPAYGYSAFATSGQSQRQDELNQAEVDKRAAALEAIKQMNAKQQAATDAFSSKYDMLRQDTAKHQSVIDQALSMGMDPSVAILSAGNYTPADDYFANLQKQQLAQAQQDQQAANLAQYGYTSPSAAASAQAAQQKLDNGQYDQNTVKLAQQMGTSPDMVEQARNSEAYQKATSVVDQIVGEAMKGGTPPTADSIRQALYVASQQDPDIMGVIPIVLYELQQQGVLFSQGYANQAG